MSEVGYRDVTCSFCGRHNRVVHMVEGRDGLRICQVCVAAAAESIDADAGVPSPPGGWSGRSVIRPAGDQDRRDEQQPQQDGDRARGSPDDAPDAESEQAEDGEVEATPVIARRTGAESLPSQDAVRRLVDLTLAGLRPVA